jgi:hypothetical protein
MEARGATNPFRNKKIKIKTRSKPNIRMRNKKK